MTLSNPLNKIALVSLLSLVVLSCSNGMTALEKESADCFSEVCSEHNIKLDTLIELIESELIAEGHFNENKGDDYVNFVQVINENNEIAHKSEQNSTTLLLCLSEIQILHSCKSRLLNEDYKGSKPNLLDSLLIQHLLNRERTPEEFAEIFLQVLDKDDFEKVYYKVFFWNMYSELYLVPKFTIGLPLKPYYNSADSSDPKCPKGFIELRENDEIYWNSNGITEDALQDSVEILIRSSIETSDKYVEVENFGKEKTTDYILYIRCAPSATYGKYIILQDIVIQSINEIRNEVAQKIYQIDYFDLDKENEKVIDSIIKKSIIEGY